MRASTGPMVRSATRMRPSDEQGGVDTTESERVRHGDGDGLGARLVRHAIEIATRVRHREVDGWRYDGLAQGEERHHELDGAGGAEPMAVNGFGGGDRDLPQAVGEYLAKRGRLGDVVGERAGAMGIDVVDGLGGEA